MGFTQRLFTALAALCLACPLSYSQDITATLQGTVTDPSGAVISSANVTVFSVDQQRQSRAVTTDASGAFNVPALAPGKYRVTVDAAGFKKSVRDGIVLNVSDRVSVNITLTVGDATQTVTVSESPVSVQLASSEQSTTVTGTQIRELALITRNYEQLVGLMPGVSANNNDQLYVGNSLPSGQTNTIPFAINGTRNSSSAWIVDGADIVDRGSNLTLLNTPSIDAIAEFKVQRSNYSAEFGRAAGGQVSVLTKSGTSDFHGDLYEFVRNDAFAANNFLNNANKLNLGADGKAMVPALRYNNFGWTLGGPLYIPKVYNNHKDKTFFFASQEFRRYITYSNTTSTVVPTDAEKQGVFPHQVCLSYTGNVCNNFGSTIPSSMINPVSQAYLKDVFSKIQSPQSGNVLSALFRNRYNFEQELYKVDHIFSQKLAVSVRFLRDQIPTTEPQGLFTADPIPGVAVTNTNSPGRNWTVRATSTFSPTWLNEAGYNYSYGAILSDPTGFMSAAASPDVHPKLPFPVTLNQIPSLTFTSGTSLTTFGPYRDFSRDHNVYDNMTKILGNHAVKFGATYNTYQKRENAGNANMGTFNFTATAVAGGASAFEQSFANFLLGNAASFSQTSADITPDIRAQQWEAYVQDDWKINRKLTLNLGVRYSMFRQPTDANGGLTNFDPASFSQANVPQVTSTGLLTINAQSYLNGIIQGGAGSRYGAKVAQENTNNWAPRIGLAYDPFGDGKTAIRTGYGIFYDATLYGTFEQNIFANPPVANAVSIANVSIDNQAAGTASVSNTPKALRAVSPQFKTPYTQQWNFDIQRQITPTLLVDAAYVGTKGTHLLGIVDINEVQPGLAYSSGLVPASTVFTSQASEMVLNQLRPYKGYGPINMVEPWFNSNYHALQVYGRKQLSADAQVSFSYTWSKNLTDSWSDRSNAPQNTYNTALEYGRAAFDRRHVFNTNVVYMLPFFKSQQGWLGKAAGGWQVSGIVYAQSGLPLTPSTSNLDPAAMGLLFSSSAAGGRPDMTCDPNSGAPNTHEQWFNTGCFSAVPAGVVRPGNAGRGVINGPGFSRVDLSLSKNIDFRERYRLQIRGEATNAFNHSNPNAVAAVETTPSTFGTVTSYRDPRIIQLAAKFYF